MLWQFCGNEIWPRCLERAVLSWSKQAWGCTCIFELSNVPHQIVFLLIEWLNDWLIDLFEKTCIKTLSHYLWLKQVWSWIYPSPVQQKILPLCGEGITSQPGCWWDEGAELYPSQSLQPIQAPQDKHQVRRRHYPFTIFFKSFLGRWGWCTDPVRGKTFVCWVTIEWSILMDLVQYHQTTLS